MSKVNLTIKFQYSADKEWNLLDFSKQKNQMLIKSHAIKN